MPVGLSLLKVCLRHSRGLELGGIVKSFVPKIFMGPNKSQPNIYINS